MFFFRCSKVRWRYSSSSKTKTGSSCNCNDGISHLIVGPPQSAGGTNFDGLCYISELGREFSQRENSVELEELCEPVCNRIRPVAPFFRLFSDLFWSSAPYPYPHLVLIFPIKTSILLSLSQAAFCSPINHISHLNLILKPSSSYV